MKNEQQAGTASRGEGVRSRVRSWFVSTGAPPAWPLVGYMVCGLVVGAAFTGLLPDFRATLLGALAGAVVAASGSGGPSGISRRVALVAAGVGFVLMAVGFATGEHPVWAALAMAAVALLTSLAAAAGPLGALLGFLVSLAYFLIATMARVADLFGLVSVPWAVAHIALGCLGGLVVVFVGTAWRRRREPEEVKAARAPVPIKPMWESLRSFDEHARDGVRRAIPLAILMFFFQQEGGRNAFWIFFAAYIVLLSTGKTPKDLAAVRVGSTLFGVVVLAVASSSCPTGCSSRSASSSSSAASASARHTRSSAVDSLRSGRSCWRARRPETSRAGRDTGSSTRSWVARSRSPRPTSSGRETGKPRRQSRSQRRRSRRHRSVDAVFEICDARVLRAA
jgi:MFS family permease